MKTLARVKDLCSLVESDVAIDTKRWVVTKKALPHAVFKSISYNCNFYCEFLPKPLQNLLQFTNNNTISIHYLESDCSKVKILSSKFPPTKCLMLFITGIYSAAAAAMNLH